MRDERQHFENAIWPHLRGAYNLARWLLGNSHDAEDVVQESFIKAFRAADRVRSEDARAWLLAIVRNTALNYRARERPKAQVALDTQAPEAVDRSSGPEASLLEKERRQRVRSAIERLPDDFREVIVLREIEGLSYKEIAWVMKIPMGTVMSRLSRARDLLLRDLMPEKEAAR